jgi:DNA-binding transcriptional regulator GbsR (MarR family)
MTPAPAQPEGAGPADWQLEFVTRVGHLSDLSGLPPSHVQVFAWLVVCDPAHQSVGQLRQTLGLSAGAISMATATLVRMGLVERITQPGERRLYYRFRPGVWHRLLRSRLDGTREIRTVADDALARAPEPPVRLAQMRDVYAWFEHKLSELLDAGPGGWD